MAAGAGGDIDTGQLVHQLFERGRWRMGGQGQSQQGSHGGEMGLPVAIGPEALVADSD
jgi:hypothetical protein